MGSRDAHHTAKPKYIELYGFLDPKQLLEAGRQAALTLAADKAQSAGAKAWPAIASTLAKDERDHASGAMTGLCSWPIVFLTLQVVRYSG